MTEHKPPGAACITFPLSHVLLCSVSGFVSFFLVFASVDLKLLGGFISANQVHYLSTRCEIQTNLGSELLFLRIISVSSCESVIIISAACDLLISLNALLHSPIGEV